MWKYRYLVLNRISDNRLHQLWVLWLYFGKSTAQEIWDYILYVEF